MPYMPISWGGARGVIGAAYMAVPLVDISRVWVCLGKDEGLGSLLVESTSYSVIYSSRVGLHWWGEDPTYTSDRDIYGLSIGHP